MLAGTLASGQDVTTVTERLPAQAESPAARPPRRLPSELVHHLQAVLLVDLGADLPEADPPGEPHGWLVVGRDRGHEGAHAMASGSPREQPEHGLRGVAAPPERLEDLVADLPPPPRAGPALEAGR